MLHVGNNLCLSLTRFCACGSLHLSQLGLYGVTDMDENKSSRELRSELRRATSILSAAKSVGDMAAESAAKVIVDDLKRKVAERVVREFMNGGKVDGVPEGNVSPRKPK